MRVARPSAPKTQEPEELPLVGAAAGAVGAEVRPANEQRIGSQVEDVVDASGDVVGELEQGADPAKYAFAPRAGSKQPKDRWSMNSMAGASAVAQRSRSTGPSSAATERAVAAARVRSGPSGRSSA